MPVAHNGACAIHYDVHDATAGAGPPLLLYGGESDSFTPAVRELATALPRARLTTVPRMGHLPL